MELAFDDAEIKEVELYISKYPQKKAAIMPVLWLAQKKWGWISKDVMIYVAGLLDLPVSHVEGVASFYTMYFKKPMGKHHIQVCTNVSCMLRQGEELYKHVSEKLGIGHNQVTADGTFSLEEVECMGACGGAPMVAVNEDYFENLDKNQLDTLIEKLRYS